MATRSLQLLLSRGRVLPFFFNLGWSGGLLYPVECLGKEVRSLLCFGLKRPVACALALRDVACKWTSLSCSAGEGTRRERRHPNQRRANHLVVSAFQTPQPCQPHMAAGAWGTPSPSSRSSSLNPVQMTDLQNRQQIRQLVLLSH